MPLFTEVFPLSIFPLWFDFGINPANEATSFPLLNLYGFPMYAMILATVGFLFHLFPLGCLQNPMNQSIFQAFLQFDSFFF